METNAPNLTEVNQILAAMQQANLLEDSPAENALEVSRQMFHLLERNDELALETKNAYYQLRKLFMFYDSLHRLQSRQAV